MLDRVLSSEIIFSSDDKVYHKITQPSEDIILDRNAELRKNEGAIRDLGSELEGGTWGRQIASIPENLYIWAIRNGYELNSRDKKHAEKELFRFLQSEKGKQCLIRSKL